MFLTDLSIQIFDCLVSGAFYTMLSLGLAMIFGMLRLISFAPGATSIVTGAVFVASRLLFRRGVVCTVLEESSNESNDER